MDFLIEVKNGVSVKPDKRDLTNVIKEKHFISTKKQSKKKPPNQIWKLFQKIQDVSRNLNRELIGGPK
jgi:hypothetical protein